MYGTFSPKVGSYRLALNHALNLWIYLEDGLGALRDGVFGDVTGKEDAHSALDLARGQGDLFVVAHVLAAWPPRR